MPATTVSVTKRLMLARYLFNQANNNANSNREVGAFAAVNMLQDAIEIFLLSAAGHLNIVLGRRTEFEQYLDKVSEALGDTKLPFRQRLIEINKVRVLSKHDGISPNPIELKGHLHDAREFFGLACKLIFQKDFWTVSLLDQLQDGEAKSLIEEAGRLYESCEYLECLTSCRKVMFIEFESKFDVQPYTTGFIPPPWEALSHPKTQDPMYIDAFVVDPFEFVQMDYERMEVELMKHGIGRGTFWNILRLAPDVYRIRSNQEWLVKYEPSKLAAATAENAAYVLENVTDIILNRELRLREYKGINFKTSMVVRLKCSKAKIFRKADSNSEVVAETPNGLIELDIQYGSPSFTGAEYFFRASYVHEDRFYFGYVSAADVEPPIPKN
jgi:hypothetical protein